MKIRLSKNNDHDGVSRKKHGVECSQESDRRLSCVIVTIDVKKPSKFITQCKDDTRHTFKTGWLRGLLVLATRRVVAFAVAFEPALSAGASAQVNEGLT